MGVVTSLIDALRRLGAPSQRAAITRQDVQLKGKQVTERRREVARSELGTSESFVATVDPVPERVEPLTPEEVEPIRRNAALAETFLAQFASDRGAGPHAVVHALDAAFERWMLAGEHGPPFTPDAVIELTGAAYGCYCADTLDMRWVRIVDADGSAIALQGRRKDFRAFPYHIVEKRVDAGEYGFFVGIYISLQDAAQREWQAIGA